MIYQAITTSQGLATHQLEAIPYLGLLFFIFNLITDPLTNYLSRKHEYQADSFAIKTTGYKVTFANSLKKLADLNLADEEPHPVVEFLFQSHPSIKNRIQKMSEVTQ
jgi:STE24 endopeptidase